jgi:L-iditol 2-dehydrogenase
MMKAAIYKGIGHIDVEEVPRPECPTNGVVVKVMSCGICGSDIRTFSHGHSLLNPPWTMGHEVSGTIDEVGSEISEYKIGQRVVVNPAISCGRCYFCSRGRQNLCSNIEYFGYHYQGGFAQYMVVPGRVLDKGNTFGFLNNDVSFDAGCTADPIGVSLHALDLSNVGIGDTVAILGAGPIGCIHALIAQMRGANRIFMSDIRPKRLELADRLGNELYIDATRQDVVKEILSVTEGFGVDVAIVACPSGEAQEQALQIVHKGGTVCLFGGLPKEKPFIEFNSNWVHYNEIKVLGSITMTPVEFNLAVDVLNKKRIDTDLFVTESFPLDRINEALTPESIDRNLRMVIHPQE